jgi:galactokinase
MVTSLPAEIAHFEALLNRPNSDPTGLAGFFNSGQILVARVPARLDIIGGIADYSGANVCEGVLGRGMVIALQPRTDRTLRLRTLQANRKSLPIETRIPLAYFELGEGFAGYDEIRDLCRANPLSSWAAYIGGSIFTLLKEESVRLPYGFSLLLLSGVPMNVGIGSSAATEIATLSCLQSYLDLNLDALRLARLGQLAENLVVGAPCGIMDQIAVTSGREGKLVHILCRPGSVEGEVDIPPGTAFVGINSMVKHSVAGSEYGDVRIGAFMGRRILNALRAAEGASRVQHLAELSVEEFERTWRDRLPEEIRGSAFLEQYRTHEDSMTEIQPDATYRVLGPTAHPIHENRRVLDFMDALRAASDGDETALRRAGECMFGCHESYRDNCQLSVPEVDFLVEAVRTRGPARGLFGAKITGGGSGGTVAVFGRAEALRKEVPEICAQYKRLTGFSPDVFEGTSPGAMEFGAIRYAFGPHGWTRSV